ncbi:hypothetical protein STRATTON_87 [Erwinia phage vB_EamM_Stratton]|uniref:Uncharacterized protein n=2 Tax=Erskinevirus EaH2 TaxID=2169883 RepID=A0A1B2IGZ7_9CAUD|nr:hypothetical protein G173_gp254 [Erwinia phage phiEaH2]AFQ96799.1 hypothetical protein [Erwinia phage phiEaH2]ANZ50512.1 hypothetical protein STRATTON_87 [Erwinia phage vB_EamM_Stratton]
MTFSDNAFAEFLSNPRIKREWDNLSNGSRHRQHDDEVTHVTAQVLLVDSTGIAYPQFEESY